MSQNQVNEVHFSITNPLENSHSILVELCPNRTTQTYLCRPMRWMLRGFRSSHEAGQMKLVSVAQYNSDLVIA